MSIENDVNVINGSSDASLFLSILLLLYLLLFFLPFLPPHIGESTPGPPSANQIVSGQPAASHRANTGATANAIYQQMGSLIRFPLGLRFDLYKHKFHGNFVFIVFIVEIFLPHFVGFFLII